MGLRSSELGLMRSYHFPVLHLGGAVGFAASAIFRPQKRQIYTWSCSFLVDVGVVGLGVQGLTCSPFREKNPFQHFAGQYHPTANLRQFFAAMRTSRIVSLEQCNDPLPILGVTAQPQDFPVVYHFGSLLGVGHDTACYYHRCNIS